MKSGLYASKSGFQATDSQKRGLLFDSDLNTLKILCEGSGNETVNHALTDIIPFISFTSDGVASALGSSKVGTFNATGDSWFGFLMDLVSDFNFVSEKDYDSSESTSKYGIKISKEGQGIKGTDPRQLVADTDLTNFMIAKVFVGTVTGDDNENPVPQFLDHGMGYAPLFMIFTKRNDQLTWLNATFGDVDYRMKHTIGDTTLTWYPGGGDIWDSNNHTWDYCIIIFLNRID